MNPIRIVGSLMGWMCEYCGDVKLGNEWICDDATVNKITQTILLTLLQNQQTISQCMISHR